MVPPAKTNPEKVGAWGIGDICFAVLHLLGFVFHFFFAGFFWPFGKTYGPIWCF